MKGSAARSLARGKAVPAGQEWKEQRDNRLGTETLLCDGKRDSNSQRVRHGKLVLKFQRSCSCIFAVLLLPNNSGVFGRLNDC